MYLCKRQNNFWRAWGRSSDGKVSLGWRELSETFISICWFYLGKSSYLKTLNEKKNTNKTTVKKKHNKWKHLGIRIIFITNMNIVTDHRLVLIF